MFIIHIYLSVYLPVCLSVCLSVMLVFPSVYLQVCLPVCLSTCLCTCLSVRLLLSVCLCISLYASLLLCQYVLFMCVCEHDYNCTCTCHHHHQHTVLRYFGDQDRRNQKELLELQVGVVETEIWIEALTRPPCTPELSFSSWAYVHTCLNSSLYIIQCGLCSNYCSFNFYINFVNNLDNDRLLHR